MISQAFISLSRSDLGVFVFARQAVAAGVADSSNGLGNMYDKRDWNQHKPVRGGRAGLMFFSEPLVGGTAMQLATYHGNAALQVAAGGRGRVRVQRTRECTVRARKLWCVQRVCTTPVPQGSTKWQKAACVGCAASQFGLPAMRVDVYRCRPCDKPDIARSSKTSAPGRTTACTLLAQDSRDIRNSVHGKEVSAPLHGRACTDACEFFVGSVVCIQTGVLSTMHVQVFTLNRC